MGKRDELIAKYAEDLQAKCRINPDLALLAKVTLGCGPLIYDPQTEVIAMGDLADLAAIKKNFLIKKLGLPASPALDEALEAALETYGAAPQKYRAVVYYMLTRHFGKEAAFR